MIFCHIHCVKCANTEVFLVRIFLYSDWIRRFTVNLRIQSENRKIRTRNNSVSGHFSRSGRIYNPVKHLWWNVFAKIVTQLTFTWSRLSLTSQKRFIIDTWKSCKYAIWPETQTKMSCHSGKKTEKETVIWKISENFLGKH